MIKACGVGSRLILIGCKMVLARMLMNGCCSACGVTQNEMRSRSRKTDVVLARHMLCYALRRLGCKWKYCGQITARSHASALVGSHAFADKLYIGDKLATKAWDALADSFGELIGTALSLKVYLRIFSE